MQFMEPNQALRTSIAVSTVLITLVQVVIIGVGVTGPA
jgi:hypothetical protein